MEEIKEIAINVQEDMYTQDITTGISKSEESKLKSEFLVSKPNLIIKKEYFISHKTSSIHDEYDIEDDPIREF